MTPRTTTMKQRAGIGLCGGMLLWAGLASAGECRQIEYAELKDMATKQLVAEYCLDDLRAQIYEFSASPVVRPYIGPRMSDEAQADARDCRDMQAKIRTALRSRSVPEEPSCESPRPGERKEEGQR